MRFYFFFLLIFISVSCNSNNNSPIENGSTTIANEESQLKKDIQAYPDSTILVQNLVSFYAKGQNYDAALATLNSSIARDSANPFLWDMRGSIAGEKGDTAQAIYCFEKAVQIYPEPTYIISLGALYAETSNPKALDLADALLQGSKARAEKEAYFIKGLFYSYKNEKAASIPFFEKCMLLDYNFMQAYLEKALSLYDLKKYDNAALVLEQAVKVQNQYDKGYYYLGQCYEKLNRREEAVEAYQIALEIDPSYQEAKDALGKLGVK
jgi:tetratricopeptide (TPR) repeat protein